MIKALNLGVAGDVVGCGSNPPGEWVVAGKPYRL